MSHFYVAKLNGRDVYLEPCQRYGSPWEKPPEECVAFSTIAALLIEKGVPFDKVGDVTPWQVRNVFLHPKDKDGNLRWRRHLTPKNIQTIDQAIDEMLKKSCVPSYMMAVERKRMMDEAPAREDAYRRRMHQTIKLLGVTSTAE